MTEVFLDTKITLNDLAEQLHYLDETDILDFIVYLDDLMADRNFTKTLRKRLKQAMKEDESPVDTGYPH